MKNAIEIDQQTFELLMFMGQWIENHRTVYRAFDLCPKEVLERIGRFTEKKPRPFMSYQEFLALHEREK